MITDYGNARVGMKAFVDVPLERDIFDKVITKETMLCELTRLVYTGKMSVWATFTTPGGMSFAVLKRITTKLMVA